MAEQNSDALANWVAYQRGPGMDAPPGTINTCKRCTPPHRWMQRMTGRPVRCPQCGSPYWDKEKKEQA